MERVKIEVVKHGVWKEDLFGKKGVLLDVITRPGERVEGVCVIDNRFHLIPLDELWAEL